MAGNVRFHSKYHSTSHHTVNTPGEYDSASDPIASPTFPFQGDFYINGSLSAKNAVFSQTTYVNVLSAGGYATSNRAVTGDYTVLFNDQTVYAHGGVSGSTLTLPAASAVPNQEFTFKRTSETSTVTLSAVGANLIDQQYTAVQLTALGATVHVASFLNTWWILYSDTI